MKQKLVETDCGFLIFQSRNQHVLDAKVRQCPLQHIRFRNFADVSCAICCTEQEQLRIVRVSKNPDANEAWVRKFDPLMKILSPFVILFGFAELIGLFN